MKGREWCKDRGDDGVVEQRETSGPKVKGYVAGLESIGKGWHLVGAGGVKELFFLIENLDEHIKIEWTHIIPVSLSLLSACLPCFITLTCVLRFSVLSVIEVLFCLPVSFIEFGLSQWILKQFRNSVCEWVLPATFLSSNTFKVLQIINGRWMEKH